MAELELRNLSKAFGDSTILSGLDLQIRDEEFLVLVGPSGCGKSTLLRLIAGLDQVSTGEILLDKEIITHKAPQHRDMAMVFQSYALYPHMKVRENLSLALVLRKVSKSIIEEKVAEVATALDISKLLDRYPKDLSGGQRQRVAMGRAIIRNPRIFLFDEPLSNLDAELRARMRTDIKKLQKRLGVTTVYVTHDQVEAMTLADRIVILKGGKIQQIGSPMEIYSKPKNSFVASFLGSPAMNFIPGVFTGNGIQVDHFPQEFYPKLTQHLKKSAPVTLGIRPDHICINNQSSDREDVFSWQGRVEVIENLGSQMLLDVTCGDSTVAVQTSYSSSYGVGNSLNLSFSSDKIHLFDHASGESIIN